MLFIWYWKNNPLFVLCTRFYLYLCGNNKIMTMKRLILISFLAIGIIISMSFVKDSDYSDGWEDGFCEGFKNIKGQYSICPITPIAPIAKMDCAEGYICGYNRGFKYGMCIAEGKKCTK